MPDRTIIFIAFAMEDQSQRNLLTGQSVNARTPFEFVDMSVKEPYDTAWKDRVRTRIRRSHGVIALVSRDSLASTGQKWEVECAREEGKPVLGVWAYSFDRTVPGFMRGVGIVPWSYDGIARFIDSL